MANSSYKARQARRRVIESTTGLILLAATLGWLVLNFFKSPTQFAQVTLIGLSNGILYALIALGYTLVYGIIELINFAHGDLFMLGGLFSAHFVTLWFHQKKSSPMGWLVFLLALISVMILSNASHIVAYAVRLNWHL